MPKDRIKILSVRVDKLTRQEALENIRLFLLSDCAHQIVTLNSEMILQARSDRILHSIVDNVDMVVADGAGVLQAASFLKRKKGNIFADLINLLAVNVCSILFPDRIRDVLPEKISGADLIHDICRSDFMDGKKIYLLGAGAGVAEKTGRVLAKMYPQVRIVGTEAGFFSEVAPQDGEGLLSRINSTSPDVIFVALGAPKQEKWIHDNLSKMPSVRLAMGVGGSFDVISGRIRRAPKIMQDHGMEWLWRLMLQPRRLKRIYNATIKFAWLIFWDKDDMIGE